MKTPDGLDINDFKRSMQNDMDTMNRMAVDVPTTNPVMDDGTHPVGYVPRPKSVDLNFRGVIEAPTSNPTGSDIVGMEQPRPDMMPIPEDMRELVAKQLRNEQRPPFQKQRPPFQKQKPPEQSQPTTNVNPPADFDFDLFHMATLREIVLDINTALETIKACEESLRSKKYKIEKMLGLK